MRHSPYTAPGIPVDSEEDDIETLERLTADLRRYAAGNGPTGAELAAAPLLRVVATQPDMSTLRLIGNVSGHPHCGPGNIVTSRIYAVDRCGTWARSYSRLYTIAPFSRWQQ
ncbi:DUF6634 family protein [Fulvimarina pelagi]|uniref:DUF6634 family protein n=1 Tax=Fulvimarina pelagi TaxID=217511 RepID=UPI0034E26902